MTLELKKFDMRWITFHANESFLQVCHILLGGDFYVIPKRLLPYIPFQILHILLEV